MQRHTSKNMIVLYPPYIYCTKCFSIIRDVIRLLTKCVRVMNKNSPPANENTNPEYSMFPRLIPMINPMNAVHADRKLKDKARRKDMPDWMSMAKSPETTMKTWLFNIRNVYTKYCLFFRVLYVFICDE